MKTTYCNKCKATVRQLKTLTIDDRLLVIEALLVTIQEDVSYMRKKFDQVVMLPEIPF